MKVHQFECKCKHIFFVPLHLPQDLTVFAETMKKIKCPLCSCGSKDISMSAKEQVVIG